MEICNIKEDWRKLICSVFYFSILIGAATAQKYQDAYLIDAPGVNTSIRKVLKSAGATYLYGTYDGQLKIDGFTLEHRGMLDVYLIKLVDGVAEWIFFGGSAASDLASDMKLNKNGELVIGGSFWSEATFGEVTLNSGGSSKALFVLKLNTDGEVISQHVINGNGTKNMAGLALIENEIYVSGSFGERLFSASTEAFAKADLDIFVLKLNTVQGVDWIRNFGIEGKHEAIDFSWDNAQNQFIVSGHYIGQIAVQTDTIQTNTFDEDIFVAAFAADGTGKWLQKAGGQFEDFNSAHTLDKDGSIYLTGDYRGIINFADGSQINTGGIMNADSYLIKFDADGNNEWARTLGSLDSIEIGTDIFYFEDKIYWTGYCDNGFTIDDVSFISPTGIFNGMLAVFDKEGQIEEGLSIVGNNLTIPNGILPEVNGVNIYGDFMGKIELDQTYDSGGDFYGFQVLLKDFLSSSSSVFTSSATAFPNPTSGVVNIILEDQAELISIFNANGLLVYSSPEQRLDHRIDLSGLAAGIYYWQVESGGVGKVFKY